MTTFKSPIVAMQIDLAEHFRNQLQQTLLRKLHEQTAAYACNKLPFDYAYTFEVGGGTYHISDEHQTATIVFEGSETIYSFNSLGNVIHDFTIGFLLPETDVKLSKISIEKVGNDLTPDGLIFSPENRDHVVVFEFGTTSRTNSKSASNYYQEKTGKYKEALTCRVKGNKKIMYAVLVISPCAIYSSVPLTPELQSYLGRRYGAAQGFYNYLYSKDLVRNDINDSLDVAKVKNAFHQIKPPTFSGDEPTAFSESLWLHRNDPITPAERAKVNAYIDDQGRKAYESTKQKARGVRFAPSRVEAKWKELLKANHGGQTTMHQKSVCNLPLWAPHPSVPGIGIEGKLPNCYGLDAAGRVLDYVIQEYNSGNYDFREDIDRVEDIAMGIVKLTADEKREFRNKYHRVQLHESDEMLAELAKVGYKAKKLKDSNGVKNYRLDKKIPMDIEIPTKDIDFFIQNMHTLLNEGTLFPNMEIAESLLKAAFKVNGDDLKWTHDAVIKFRQWIHRTDLYKALAVNAQVAHELAIARRQTCKTNDIIFKRISGTEIYLIIKPCNNSGPECFMIAAKKQYVKQSNVCGDVFRSPAGSDETWVWTQMISATEDKLTNWVKASEVLVSALAFAFDMYEVDILSETPYSLQAGFHEACQTASVILLISCHDKHITEEIFTLSRFLNLQGMKSHPESPEPEALIAEMTPYPRSRLQVWAMNRMKDQAIYIHRSSGYLDVTTNTIDSSKFRCTWTQLPLKNFDQLVGTFYYGYFTNKDIQVRIHHMTGLYEKIISQEELLPYLDGKYNPKYMGPAEPEDYDEMNLHEFSPAMIKIICDHLKSTKGGDEVVKKTVSESINFDLARTTLDTLGTAKATSNFSDDLLEHNFQHYHRSKMIEKVFEDAEGDNFTLTDVMGKALDALEKSCMHVCIFRKAQQGGPREIYVMESPARYVQKVLETMAAAVCKLMPHETMTHPVSKQTIPEDTFGRLAKKVGKKRKLMVQNLSDDAQKWSQRMSGAKLFLTLIQFLDEIYHNFVFRAMRLWEKKKIMINVELLNHFKRMEEKGIELDSHCKVAKDMYDCYTGVKKAPWSGGRHRTYIQLKSGMMQGILHYTSSLLHALYMKYFREVVTPTVLAPLLLKPYIKGFDSYCLVSSDDSSMSLMFAVTKLNTMQQRAILFMCSVVFELKGRLSKLIGIHESKKKKISNTPFFIEFNSEFRDSRTLIRPTIKYVAASMNLQENEMFVAKLEQAYNSITQIVENGGSFLLASICQTNQLVLHYMMLGFRINCLFEKAAELLIGTSDVTQGFFPLDEPAYAGLPGFNNLYYRCVTSSPALRSKFQRLLNGLNGIRFTTPEARQRAKEALNTLSVGVITKGSSISPGDRKKWKLMKTNTIGDFPFTDIINEEPMIIFERPKSAKAVRCQLSLKICSPGMTESLSRDNSVSRMMSLSVYALTSDIFCQRSAYLNEEPSHLEIKYEMQSLYKALSEAYVTESMSKEDLQFIFPYCDDYESLRELMKQFSTCTYSRMSEVKVKRRCRITVFSEGAMPRISLEQLCVDRWWGMRFGRWNSTERNIQWESAKKSYKWLRDSFDETLAMSPFTDVRGLKQFLMEQRPKQREVHMTGSIGRQVSGVINLITAISNNFWSRSILSFGTDTVAHADSTKVKQTLHGLYLNAKYTLGSREDLKRAGDLIVSEYCDFSNEAHPGSQKAKLAVFKMFLDEVADANILLKVSDLRLGVVGYWRKEQHYSEVLEKWIGHGTWVGRLAGVITTIEVASSTVSYITKIQTQKAISGQHLTTFINTLEMWCDWTKIQPTRPASEALQERPSSFFACIDSSFNRVEIKSMFGHFQYFSVNRDLVYELDMKKLPGELSLEFERNVVRLCYKLADCETNNRVRSILTMKLHPGMFESNQAYDFGKLRPNLPLVHYSWIANLPLPKEESLIRMREIYRSDLCDSLLKPLVSEYLTDAGLIARGRDISYLAPDVIEEDDKPEAAMDLDDLLLNFEELDALVDAMALVAPPISLNDPDYVCHMDEMFADVMDIFPEENFSAEDQMGLYYLQKEVDSWQRNQLLHRAFKDSFSYCSVREMRELENDKVISSHQRDMAWVSLLCLHFGYNVDELQVLRRGAM